MAIIFSKERKKQQNLIVVFVVVAIITAGVFYFGVLRKPVKEGVIASRPARRVEINFNIFNQQILKEMELFEPIDEFQGETKRENIFFP